jgi:hypothetical protein
MSSALATAALANTHNSTNATGADRTDLMTASLITCEGYRTAPTRSRCNETAAALLMGT